MVFKRIFIGLAILISLHTLEFLCIPKNLHALSTPETIAEFDKIPLDAVIERSRAILHQFGGDDLSAFFGFIPRIELIHSDFPNAYAVPPNRIVLSTSLVKRLDSLTELRFLIAHELGHLKLEHNGQLNNLVLEAEADQYADKLLSRMGENQQVGIRFLSKLAHFSTIAPYPTVELIHRIARLSSFQDPNKPLLFQ